ncbi:MAG TPA: 2-oxo acid dehydrogenase subunit E2 [Verrucomicrobiae bacterium]|jgi:pyruvate dehydrogenase E2 component (dihydrolipoamide acetyltransferase)|nr:2-oxo acid dehydrogenase subunit E2 [Verrucomicrobiae bacterium]
MDVKLPHLGEGADSGTVVNLFVKEGDQIAKDQPILELENEKAVATIPSTGAGTIARVFVKAGDKISVGQKILSLSGDGAAPATAKPTAAAPQAKAKAPAPEPEAEPEQEEEISAESGEAREASNAAVAASPVIRKLARDLGIDLARVRGTARGGRVTMEDLRAYIQRLQKLAAQPKTSAGATLAKPAAESVDFSKWGSVTKKPLSPLRQVIARRMTENWNTIPHVTQFDEADITGLLVLRKKYVEAYGKKGARLTVTSFVLKAVADTLKKHPFFNCSLDEATQEIVLKEYVHIGVAVDTESGLIVPVLRDADKKDLVQLSKNLEELAAKARERKVSGEELKGGSFTISNQGGIGGGHFTPIINKPEVAILGLGKGAIKAVVRENKIEPRTILPVALSYDHRVIDGGGAARFIVDLVKAIENFDEKLVQV